MSAPRRFKSPILQAKHEAALKAEVSKLSARVGMLKLSQKAKAHPRRQGNAMKPQARSIGPRVGVASAYSRKVTGVEPVITTMGGSSRVRHRELLGNLVGQTSFAAGFNFALNPGIANSFPWLSTIAQNFEKYHFNKLVFKYITRTGTETPGSVYMIPDYDAADSPPVSESLAASYKDMVEDAPWKDIDCPLSVRDLHSTGEELFVRSAVLPSNLDIKLYDAGRMFINTNDAATSATPFGKIWVEYDVTLSIPSLSLVANTPSQSYIHIKGTTQTSNNILQSPVVISGTLPYSVAGGSIALATGTYLLCYYSVASSSTTFGTPTMLNGSLATSYGSSSAGYNVGGSGTTLATITAMFTITANGGAITLATTVSNGTNDDLVVVKLPSGST
jgi:hypothetical protein